MEFKKCYKCGKTYFKPLGFKKGKRMCINCEGGKSPVISIEDAGKRG